MFQDNTPNFETDVGRQFERTMPSAIDAEQCLIASMILDRELIGQVQEVLSDKAAFYQTDYQIFYEVLVQLYNQGKPVDAVILRDELVRRNVWEDCGGAPAIARIFDAIPSAAHGMHYAGIVQQKFILRQIIEASNQALRECYDPQSEAGEVLDRYEARALEVGGRRTSSGIPVAAIDIAGGVMDKLTNPQRIEGIKTGFIELDDMLAGFHDGELIIVAGRPGMGKTAGMLGIVEHVATTSKLPCAIFSMEMSKESLIQRMICSHGEIDAQQARTGTIPKDQYGGVIHSTNLIGGSPIWIVDASANTVGGVRAASRRLQQQHGIKLVLVDYLQLMDAPEITESRQQQVTAISRGLKAIARDLNLPVVALCQLNRSSETRDGHKPKLSGLRESGSLEQDADVVLLLHREDYYKQDEPDFHPDNIAEWIVAKQRNGPTGFVKMVWDGSVTKFRNLAARHQAAAYPDF